MTWNAVELAGLESSIPIAQERTENVTDCSELLLGRSGPFSWPQGLDTQPQRPVFSSPG